MLEELNKKIKDAMKAKDKERLQSLRFLKSKLMENTTSKTPIMEQDVVISHYKKLNDSLQHYPQGNPIRDKTIEELKVVAQFMPKQLEQADVEKIISDIKNSQESPNMGSIMKELTPQIKGKFNGKQASSLVQAALVKKI